MKIKLTIVSFLIFAFCFSIYGQDTLKPKSRFVQKYKWGVGVGFGATTGLGISLKYHPKRNGIQLNFMPYIDNENYEKFISVGLTLTHDLEKTKYSNFYLYFANSLMYRSSREISYEQLPLAQFYLDHYYYTDTYLKYNSGLGFGFEFDTQRRVVLNLMGGYAQYDCFNKLFFTAEAAVYYRFGNNK